LIRNGQKSFRNFWNPARKQDLSSVSTALKRLDLLDGADIKRTKSTAVWEFVRDATLTQRLFARYDWIDKDVTMDGAFSRRYQALSEEQRSLVDEIFKIGHDTREQILELTQSLALRTSQRQIDGIKSSQSQRIANAEARTETPDAAKKARDKLIKRDEARIKGIQLKLEKTQALVTKQGGKIALYAPMQRVGSYAVIGKSQALLDAEHAGDTKRIEALKENGEDYRAAFAMMNAHAKIWTPLPRIKQTTRRSQRRRYQRIKSGNKAGSVKNIWSCTRQCSHEIV
jgi:hypothetical protein